MSRKSEHEGIDDVTEEQSVIGVEIVAAMLTSLTEKMAMFDSNMAEEFHVNKVKQDNERIE